MSHRNDRRDAMGSTLVTSTQVTGTGRLLDLDHGTEREVRYEVWHEEDGISGQLYLRNPQTLIGFDWFEYVGPNREVILIVSTGRRLRLGRVLLDGQFTGATFER
jgi:hypothetical protein